jgi:hypothetical protein
MYAEELVNFVFKEGALWDLKINIVIIRTSAGNMGSDWKLCDRNPRSVSKKIRSYKLIQNT